MPLRPSRTGNDHVNEDNWATPPGGKHPRRGTGRTPVPSSSVRDRSVERRTVRSSAPSAPVKSKRRRSVSSRTSGKSHVRRRASVEQKLRHLDVPRKDFFELRQYPPPIQRRLGTRLSAVPLSKESSHHPLLVGDFTRTSVVLSQYDDERHRTLGGAPTPEIPRFGSADEDEENPEPKTGETTNATSRGSLSRGSSVEGLTGSRRRTADDIVTRLSAEESRRHTLDAALLRQRSAQDEEDRPRTSYTTTPRGSIGGTREGSVIASREPGSVAGSVVRSTPGSVTRSTPGSVVRSTPGSVVRSTPGSVVRSAPESVDVGRSPGAETRDSGASFVGEQRLTGDEEEVGGWRPRDEGDEEDDPDRRATKHDYLSGSVQPGDEDGDSKPAGSRADDEQVADENAVADEKEPPAADEAEILDNEVPPDEEGGSSKRVTEPQPEPFNRDVFLMSVLLVLATSYAWNIIQSCSTELKFAMPNVYGKRGWMAPWYLAALLRGAVSLVKLGELYDDAEQVEQVDQWAVAFMKTLGLALLTGEIQCEVLMAGLPTSPAFWFFLGAIPFAMKLNADHDPESPFARIPDIYLGSLIFLQFLMGISAKRWLMLFNPMILGLAFFDHGYAFSSDAYLYMIVMNLFYAIAIDKRLHGGPCPPPVMNNCNRCG